MGLFGNNKNKEDKKKNKTLQKAQKFARKGQIDKAVAEWESLLKKKSDDANVYNTIGDLYLKGKKKESAVAAYHKACEIYAASGFSLKAIAVNKKVLKIDPQNLDALTLMAQLNKERGMITNAKECYLSIAEHHIRKGAHDKALDAYKHIVDMDPRNIKVKLGLAELYFKESRIEEGTRIYGEVIGAFLEQSKFDEAEKLCKKLEENQSSPKDSLRYRVQIQLAQDRIDEAHQCFSEFEEEVDQDPELAVIKAEILIRKGQSEEGLSMIQSIDRGAITEFYRLKIFRFFLKASQIDQAFEVLIELADTYSQPHQLEDLLALHLQVLAEDASHLMVRHRMVDILKKMKRNQEVIQQYKEIGKIYASEGQMDEARNVYEKVLDMTPGDLEVQAFLNNIKEGAGQDETPAFGEVVIDSESEEGAETETKTETKTETGTETETETETTSEQGVYEIDDEMELETLESEADVKAEETIEADTAKVVELSEEEEGGLEIIEEVPEVHQVDEDNKTFLADNITEADVYIKYGHMKKAMVHLEKNLEMSPKNVPSHERLLQIFVEQGNTPEQINTLLILAKLYRNQKEHEKSDEALNEVIALDPGNEEAQRLLREGPTALQSSAIDEVPEEVTNLDFEFDDVDKAEESAGAEVTREIELTEEPAESEESLSEFLDEANFYLQQGMVDEAKVIYEKILSLHPHRADIANKLEMISGNGEKGAAATPEELSQMTSDAPEGIVEELESPAPAEEVPVIEIDEPEVDVSPSNAPDDFINFAEELREEIDSSVSDILQETPEVPEGEGEFLDFSSELRKEVEQSIASDGNAFGDSDVMEIFSEFREGVQRELEDEDHETHYNLGIAYLEMGLIDEACEEFTIASREPKRLMDCMTMVGLCYIQKGEFQKAFQELEKGLLVKGRSDEEYIGIRYEIARVCEELGDKERAAQELFQIHAISPNYRDITNKLRELGVSQKEMTPEAAKVQPKKSKVSYL